MGTLHVTHRHSRLPRARRPRPRICLRKGCGRRYQPRCSSQRYCQDSECLRQVRRWQERPAARLNIVRMTASKPSMPRPRRSGGGEPKSRSRPLRTPKLRPRVVTQQKLFFPPLVRSARVSRIPRELTAQPGSLLLRRLPSGGSQRLGPGTQVAFSRDFGWPQETGHRIPGRSPEPILASADHRCRSATAGTPAMTTLPRCAGRHLSRGSRRLL